mgnify:CR=1 FL=1
MPKHYKDMIDELINKMDEDAPANAVAHGGVDMAPNARPRAKGRAAPILKPYSSVTIILSETKKMESHGSKS